MKIVATGATSFVGTGAVKELLNRGHQVYAVLREGSLKTEQLADHGVYHPNLTILEEDLGSLLRLTERIDGPCDVFLHMGWRGAGNSSRKDPLVQEQSVADSLQAMETAAGLGCRRFLFTGSQAECGFHE